MRKRAIATFASRAMRLCWRAGTETIRSTASAIAVWSLSEPGGALYRNLGAWSATMFIGSTFDGDLKEVCLRSLRIENHQTPG
ncbi:MAG TPA: hypothetical protein VNE42_09160 [Acidimicrobiales bacterium]|nr:hypothetical protein [Acidimicrobiales bacterium]